MNRTNSCFPVFYIPVNEEQKILYKILRRLNINDIQVDVVDDDIVAYDEDDTWNGKEFYSFLIDEAFVWNGKSVLGIEDELLETFLSFAKKRGVSECCAL